MHDFVILLLFACYMIISVAVLTVLTLYELVQTTYHAYMQQSSVPKW